MKTDAAARHLATVLIVDDFEDNRQMYAEFLTYSGYRVVEATDGAEAVARAKELAPDLVVMDLSLPVMDGWEATRRLKSDPQTRHIPILALTGHSFDGHSKEARDAGCDGFLTKPCLPERLLQAIRQVLSSTASQRW
jgi:two-component system cell cycle response regulator DivK